MAEFSNEEEFRTEFESLQTQDEIDEWGLNDYLPDSDDQQLDDFIAENYYRIPEHAWAAEFSHETGDGDLRDEDDPLVWLILRQGHMMGNRTRQWYDDVHEMVVQESDCNCCNGNQQPPLTGIDALHQNQMDYIATLPVAPLDPINRYNSQGPPPEYVEPPPVYTTPEFSPNDQPCKLNMCVNDAMPGSEFCSSCHGAKGRRITRRHRSRKPRSRKPRSRKPRSRKPRSRKPARARKKPIQSRRKPRRSRRKPRRSRMKTKKKKYVHKKGK